MGGLRLSDNRKTSFKPNHNNTFGLSYGLPDDGGTCPGATTKEGGCLNVRDGLKRPTCYMAKITSIYKSVGKVLKDNTDLLKGKTQKEMEVVCRETVENFIAKNSKEHWYFRLHYSGDFFSLDYANAWSKVMKEFPEVKFWAYTRSYDFIEPLLEAKNLTLYLSCDPDNLNKALKLFNKHKDTYVNLGLAWLGNTPPAIKDIKFVTCPETSGHIKNLKERGACAKCRLCIDNYKTRVKNISFVLH